MAHLLGDHNVHGISNVYLRVNNGIEKITLNANVTSATLTHRSTRVCAIEATVSSDANPATIILPTVSTLPAGKEWSWTGLFFDSTVPVKIVTESNVLLFTAFPNDVVEVMWVASENNWKVVSHLKDEKKERLTGMLYPVGTDTVELTVNSSNNKQYLVISDRVLFFNYGDGTTKRVFFKESVIEVPATASGNTEPTYVSINDAGAVIFDNTPITMDSRDRVLIARGIRVKISNVWNLTNFKYMPYLADTDTLLRSAALVAHKFCVFPIESTSQSRIRFTDFDLIQEGINYENSTLNPDRLHVNAANPGVFYTFYPNTMSLTSSSEVDGNVYYVVGSGTTGTVPADKYTVQVLLSSPRGEIWRLYGQELFNSVEDAANAALGTTWDVTGLPTDGVAVAAFVIKGDQYSGSSTLNLLSRNNFTICSIPQQLLSEGSAGGASAPMVSGNTVLQENVVVGTESSIKNFNFKSHVPITVSGDTVTVSVNGVENANTSNVEVPVVHTWTGTQDEYDDLTVHNANTIYNIVDDNENSLNNLYHPPLLSCMWSDHKLNDIHWLRADTFSWQSGEIYKAVYNHLLQDITEKTYTYLYAWMKTTANNDIYYTLTENPVVGDCLYDDGSIFVTDDITGVRKYAKIISISSGGALGLANGDFYVRQTLNDIDYGSYIPLTEDDCFVASDGHKIFASLADSAAYNIYDLENTAINYYNNTGVAWYFILDTENQRFKLPRTKFGFTGLRTNVGDYVKPDALLPNITGQADGNIQGAARDWGASSSGALEWIGWRNDASWEDNMGGYAGIKFDASKSSSVYSGDGTNTKIQPAATQMYLYFYVGSYTSNAITQTAGLNAELFNSKVDLNAANLSNAGKSLIAGLGMPSSVYDDLTLGASGTTYLAPANGWFFIRKRAGTPGFNPFIALYDTTIGLAVESRPGANGEVSIQLILPIQKGHTARVDYDATGTTDYFRFYYAVGATN